MTPYLYLIATGLLVAFASFAFAAFNMAAHVKHMVGDGPNPEVFGGMFTRHLGAIVGVAFGGLLFVVGVILLILDVL